MSQLWCPCPLTASVSHTGTDAGFCFWVEIRVAWMHFEVKVFILVFPSLHITFCMSSKGLISFCQWVFLWLHWNLLRSRVRISWKAPPNRNDPAESSSVEARNLQCFVCFFLIDFFVRFSSHLVTLLISQKWLSGCVYAQFVQAFDWC